MCKTSGVLSCINNMCSCPSNVTGWFWFAGTQVCIYCPATWTLFNSHCFYVNTNRKSWSDALTWCRSQNADLMKVADQNDYNLLLSFYQQYANNGNLWVFCKKMQ